MALRGERFHINLPDALSSVQANQDEHLGDDHQMESSRPTIPVKDITERPTGNVPVPPAPKPNSRGFPEHRRRSGASAWTQQKESSQSDLSHVAKHVEQQPDTVMAEAQNESSSIDRENTQKLASMSTSEIERERNEILENLSPSLVQRLLKHSATGKTRGVLNENNEARPDDSNANPPNESSTSEATKFASKVRFADETSTASLSARHGSEPEAEAQTKNAPTNEECSFHFPKPEQPPSLDPSSASFLDDLHGKYFASLPSDPSKLAWMQQPTSDTSYNADSQNVQIADLRFDFSGAIITPRQAENISATEGLHHHEDAPQSAGYTLPELARLAHSAIPSQRCIGFQTLGRILYRLGVGELGDFEDQIPQGLWMVVRDGAVIETLQAEADRSTGHMSSKAYATEALWLWQKGGGRQLKAE